MRPRRLDCVAYRTSIGVRLPITLRCLWVELVEGLMYDIIVRTKKYVPGTMPSGGKHKGNGTGAYNWFYRQQTRTSSMMCMETVHLSPNQVKNPLAIPLVGKRRSVTKIEVGYRWSLLCPFHFRAGSSSNLSRRVVHILQKYGLPGSVRLASSPRFLSKD